VSGIVYLVGAGPGDPALLTVRGHTLLRTCDVIVHDRLVHPDLIPADATAERIYVGKRDHDATSWTQEAINTLLVSLAQAGKRIVRLKGGDPFVFGRGGEEGQAIVRAGLPFEVVPGVTSGTAVPAYAGIPVTHRGVSASVTFVTANADPMRVNAPVDWQAMAKVPGTLVLFMGARTFSAIVPRLIEGGLSPDTPAAGIEWGTYEHQRTIVATLATLAGAMDAAGLGAPVSIVIGNVVTLRDELNWFGR